MSTEQASSHEVEPDQSLNVTLTLLSKEALSNELYPGYAKLIMLYKSDTVPYNNSGGIIVADNLGRDLVCDVQTAIAQLCSGQTLQTSTLFKTLDYSEGTLSNIENNNSISAELLNRLTKWFIDLAVHKKLDRVNEDDLAQCPIHRQSRSKTNDGLKITAYIRDMMQTIVTGLKADYPGVSTQRLQSMCHYEGATSTKLSQIIRSEYYKSIPIRLFEQLLSLRFRMAQGLATDYTVTVDQENFEFLLSDLQQFLADKLGFPGKVLTRAATLRILGLNDLTHRPTRISYENAQILLQPYNWGDADFNKIDTSDLSFKREMVEVNEHLIDMVQLVLDYLQQEYPYLSYNRMGIILGLRSHQINQTLSRMRSSQCSAIGSDMIDALISQLPIEIKKLEEEEFFNFFPIGNRRSHKQAQIDFFGSNEENNPEELESQDGRFKLALGLWRSEYRPTTRPTKSTERDMMEQYIDTHLSQHLLENTISDIALRVGIAEATLVAVRDGSRRPHIATLLKIYSYLQNPEKAEANLLLERAAVIIQRLRSRFITSLQLIAEITGIPYTWICQVNSGRIDQTALKDLRTRATVMEQALRLGEEGFFEKYKPGRTWAEYRYFRELVSNDLAHQIMTETSNDAKSRYKAAVDIWEKDKEA